MYTIKMNDDKSLRITEKVTLYQREKLVDKMRFLIPSKYKDVDLSDFTTILKYKDQASVAHMEILTKSENQEYEEYLEYVLPIDTDLTQFAGDIEIRITLLKTDLENKTQYILHTGEAIITISPLEDYYTFVTDESLEYIDKIVGDLNTKIEMLNKISEVYDGTKADDIIRYEDGKIQLTANGIPIGSQVSIIDAENADELKIVEF